MKSGKYDGVNPEKSAFAFISVGTAVRRGRLFIAGINVTQEHSTIFEHQTLNKMSSGQGIDSKKLHAGHQI